MNNLFFSVLPKLLIVRIEKIFNKNMLFMLNQVKIFFHYLFVIRTRVDKGIFFQNIFEKKVHHIFCFHFEWNTCHNIDLMVLITNIILVFVQILRVRVRGRDWGGGEGEGVSEGVRVRVKIFS